MKKIFKYIRDAVKELGFVTWPKRDVLVRHSIIVLCVTLAFAAVFFLVDGGMRILVNQYITATEPFHGTGTTMSGATLPGAISPTDLGTIQLDGNSIPGIETVPVTQ